MTEHREGDGHYHARDGRYYDIPRGSRPSAEAQRLADWFIAVFILGVAIGILVGGLAMLVLSK